ncbi:hypothetical protein ABZ379_40215 [Streptomyces canus]|uniref:hypothetical protein n=1 Tax=Streptomyces canus TaxID=58343 RepID=UPI0033E79D2E
MVTPTRSSNTRLGLQYPYEIEEGSAMAVEVAVLLILGIVIVFTCRGGGLKAGHAVVCTVFGLYLAGTHSVGPFVQDVMASLAKFLSGLRL